MRHPVSNLTRDFFGSIPEDFENRGESAITKLPMRNIQWQNHHKKHQTTANRMAMLYFFDEVGTAVWPREFYHRNFLLKKSGKIAVAIPRFLLRKKNKTTVIRFAVTWCYGAFAIVYSSLVTLLWLIQRDSRNLRELTRRRPGILPPTFRCWSHYAMIIWLSSLFQVREFYMFLNMRYSLFSFTGRPRGSNPRFPCSKSHVLPSTPL